MFTHPPRPASLLALLWCVLGAWLCGSAQQQTHIVDVGLNFSASFTDRDTGKNSFNGPVPTAVRVGDSVQWIFNYTHSSTSGSCPPPNFFCIPNGIWDSTIRSGNPNQTDTFTRTFNTLGTFSYFCQIHLSAMQGQVIVLNGPEFMMKVVNNSFPPPPIPEVTALAGQTANFNGTITGLLGYANPVNLTCQNGTPRVPSFCPGASVTPVGTQDVPFTFAVGDSTAGTYSFDIVATGTDPGQITKTQRVKLNVPDLALSAPSPDVISVVTGFTSPSISTQVEAIGGFTGFGNVFCNNVPAGASCVVFPNSFQFSANTPSTQSVAVLLDPGSAAPAIYSLNLVASTFFAGTQVDRTRPLTLRLLPADRFTINVPANAAPNTPANVTVHAVDPNGADIHNYGGTIHFTSTDPIAVLPPDYTFNGPASDNGVHTFSITFKTVGPRTITVADTSPFALQVTSGIVKVDTLSPNNSIVLQSSRANTVPPHFRDGNVTLTATVSSASGTPTGTVRFFDGARELGSATLSSSTPGTATASLTTNGLRPGGNVISAAYEGSLSFSANLSLEISQPRSPAPRCQTDRCP